MLNAIFGGSASPTPDFKLKKVPLASETQVRLGGSPRLMVLVLASSNTMPLEPFFSYAPWLLLCLSDVGFPPSVIHQLAGVCQCQWLGGHPSEH
jgi:hypothetical protein